MQGVIGCMPIRLPARHTHYDYERKGVYSAWENRMVSIDGRFWAVDSSFICCATTGEYLREYLWSLYQKSVMIVYC
jgi:hypothetical protein